MQILRGAHVIDRSQGIDRVVDVAIADGKIHSIGQTFEEAEVIDVSGSYLSPGWIDIHVHVYGTLGFADPDSIGVYQGVTSFVEAVPDALVAHVQLSRLLNGPGGRV